MKIIGQHATVNWIKTKPKLAGNQVSFGGKKKFSKPRVPGRVHKVLTFAQIHVPGYTRF